MGGGRLQQRLDSGRMKLQQRLDVGSTEGWMRGSTRVGCGGASVIYVIETRRVLKYITMFKII